MDFFTVPTVTFKLLYCFFIISHDRRQILHVNVTRHPTSIWIAQQLREAIKMIAYRAETSLVSLLREHLARSDDARTLVRQIFETEADLLPDPNAKTLTVRIHHLTQSAHDQVLEKLCSALNETQTVFPGTDLTLLFKIGSP
jgi:hypothetical protein